MILYYAPGTCSQACHIALIAAGLPYRLIQVGRDKQTEDGRDYKTINPKGYTPALELDDGTILTENLAILVYIAETSGKLLPTAGLERFRTLEATAFMTTEIHRNFIPFFSPDSTAAEKDKAAQTLAFRFSSLDAQLADKPLLTGAQLSVADAYLFVMLSWAAMMGITVSARLQSYFERIKQQPAVQQALREEGLA